MVVAEWFGVALGLVEHIFQPVEVAVGQLAVAELLGSMEFEAGQRIVAQHMLVRQMGFAELALELVAQFVFELELVEERKLAVIEPLV